MRPSNSIFLNSITLGYSARQKPRRLAHVLTGVVALSMASTAMAQLPSMAAYWDMDDGAGTTVTESVAGYNGTFNDPTWVPGISGTAASFAAGSYILVPHTPALDFGNVDHFFISMWVKYPTAPTAENALLIKGTIPFVDGVSTGRRYVLFDKNGATRVD